MGLPKITVVMPSYNQAAYVEESILSVLEQGYSNLEFIVLDGGSTDGSQSIIEQYSKDYAYWHSKPDNGQTDALIQGFSMASGEILGWVNSDDVLFPGALTSISESYQANPQSGIFAGNYVVINKDGRIVRCKNHPRRYDWFGRRGFQVISPEWFFTKVAYIQSGGLNPQINYAMDLDLYMRMLTAGIHGAYIPRDLIGFRLHDSSKTVSQQHKFDQEQDLIAQWQKQQHGHQINSARIKMIYHLWQLLTGNHVRSLINTIRYRGTYWRQYAQSRTSVLA